MKYLFGFMLAIVMLLDRPADPRPLDKQDEIDYVTFLPKSLGQKDDCINRNADYECPNESTLEAVCASGNVSAQIRCCEDEACKAVAAEFARQSVLSLSQK